ncbi:MAG TPA: GlsB/YeaQ/YmgE family stress response membrane protein [Xanthobacteraceae bacterium]|nr:GlsB/YeaQ/YmgE family stress response membrane protein [Xanthobacteraceae bacterium]
MLAGESIIVILIVGLVAGWLAGKIVRGAGFGLIWDIIIGVVGAFIGSWLWNILHLPVIFHNHWIDLIVIATIGAVVLLVILRLVRR